MNYCFACGRACEAPTLHLLSRSWATHIGHPHQQEWKWLGIFTQRGNGRCGHYKGVYGIFDGRAHVNSSQQFTTTADGRRGLQRTIAWQARSSSRHEQRHQSSSSIRRHHNKVSPARRQPEELYRNFHGSIIRSSGRMVAREWGSTFE